MPVPYRRSHRSYWRVAWLVCLLGSFSAVSPHRFSAWAGLFRPLVSDTAAPTEPKETWMGMYMGAKKIGYTSLRIAPTTYQNKPALRLSSKGVTKLTLLGSSVEQDENEETLTDLNYRPLKQFIDIQSNGSTMRLEAVYDYAARKVTCKLQSGETTTPKTIAIPAGANLAADPNFISAGQKVTVGQKQTFYFLNPLSVALETASVEVTGRETLKDGTTGKSVEAFVIKARMSLGEFTTWETADGDTLKGEMSLGGIALTMFKETKETALNLETGTPPPSSSGDKTTYTPPADFAVATAIVADKPIANPRELRKLRVTISGIPDAKYILSDSRQKMETLPSSAASTPLTVKAEITAQEFTPEKAAQAPVTEASLKPYLQKAAYLDTSDPNIRSTAARLRGKEQNLYRVAVRIRDWVHKAMTPDPSIGVPRGASDVFLRRRGVCRDYATLYTALARSAGVPTRICGGIVYAQGRFFYHAWAESYVGDWIAFDPTLYDPAHPVEYVDATHIKFAQGDVTEMYDSVGVIGKLHLTVQNFEN